MAAKIQDGGQKSIKASQKLTLAYTYLKSGNYVDQTLCNIKDILDIELFNMAAKIQDGDQQSIKHLKSTPLHVLV